MSTSIELFQVYWLGSRVYCRFIVTFLCSCTQDTYLSGDWPYSFFKWYGQRVLTPSTGRTFLVLCVHFLEDNKFPELISLFTEVDIIMNLKKSILKFTQNETTWSGLANGCKITNGKKRSKKRVSQKGNEAWIQTTTI